jgi:hypothetical protein
LDKLEQLIKKLSDLKEDLTKGINESYASEPNMSKDEQKVNLNNPYNEQPQKSSKKKKDDKLDLASPGHQFGNVKKADECHEDDPKHEKKEQDKAKKIKEKAEEILDMHKGETCSFAKNGQWSLNKAIYFGGESVKTSQQGEKRGSKGQQMNFPHYEADTGVSHEENVKQAKEHFAKHPHIKQMSNARLSAYVGERILDAKKQES